MMNIEKLKTESRAEQGGDQNGTPTLPFKSVSLIGTEAKSSSLKMKRKHSLSLSIKSSWSMHTGSKKDACEKEESPIELLK